MRIGLLGVGCLAAFGAVADIQSFSTSEDHKSLIYRTSSDNDYTPSLLEDQVEFSQIQISGDRKLIGWVATFQTCCASYPVPLKLVVSSESGSRSTFAGAQGLFKWCFVPELKAVAFRQEPLHGPTVETYTLARIEDGKELETYVVPLSDLKTPASINRLPKWAYCASEQ